jgi:hypothetical protein
MAQYSRTNYEALYGTGGANFPDNTTEQISEATMRTFGKDTSDSFLSNVNDIQRLTSTTGTNSYAITGGITAYANGFTVIVKFVNASSAASTLSVNGIGAKKLYTTPTSQAGSGDLPANHIAICVYDSALDSAAGGFLILGRNTINGGTP